MSNLLPEIRERVPLPEAEGCGCCEGVQVETPQAIDNRSGLPAVAYRVGDYSRFRASLLAALSGSKLGTRDESDFTIALIDAFACAADVLTFYQERLANESFLSTAIERVSLQELGKLVGYELRPGLAAETWLPFALEVPPKAPPELASEPGSFVTGVPTRVSLPAGIRVQSVPGPEEGPQAFETVEALDEARPEWNGLRPWLGEKTPPKNGDTISYLAGVGNNLSRGDGLLFVVGFHEFAFRVLDRVDVDAEQDRTAVSWKRPLSGFSDGASPSVFVLRQRLAMFGHDAPVIEPTTPPAAPSSPTSGGTDPAIHPVGGEVAPKKILDDMSLTLDGVHPEILQGSWVVLAKGPLEFPLERQPVPGEGVGAFKVNSVSEVSRTRLLYPPGGQPPLHTFSSKVTRLELGAESDGDYDRFRGAVHSTTVFASSERLEYAAYPLEAQVSGDRIPVEGGGEGLVGRRIIVRGMRKTDHTSFAARARVVEAIPLAGGVELRIDPALPRDIELVRDSVVVHANVALASHGESVSELLGAGDASQAFQSFELKHQPLTYRGAENELGARAEITLRVSNVAWAEAPTLYGAAPTDQVYSLARNEQGRVLAVFGDGVRGARLPSGVNNVRVSYRKGLGAEGNVGADQLSQLVTRPLGLKGVTNPLAAEGGTDPEHAEGARQNIPLTTRTLGRLVSLLDYADFARAFGGIAKAEAQVLPTSAGNVVAVTIAASGGGTLTPASPVWHNLLSALRKSGDPFVPLLLLACSVKNFEIGLRLKTDPAYDRSEVLGTVEARLRARYSFDRRELGQPVQSSEVIAAAQQTPGVVAVALVALHLSGESPARPVRLLAARTHYANGEARPAELLVLHPEKKVRLEELS